MYMEILKINIKLNSIKKSGLLVTSARLNLDMMPYYVLQRDVYTQFYYKLVLWRKKRKKIKPSHLLALATTLMINECCVLHLACLKTIKPWRFSKASFLGPTSKSLIFIFIFPPPCTSKNTDAHPHPDCPMTPDGGVHESHYLSKTSL